MMISFDEGFFPGATVAGAMRRVGSGNDIGVAATQQVEMEIYDELRARRAVLDDPFIVQPPGLDARQHLQDVFLGFGIGKRHFALPSHYVFLELPALRAIVGRFDGKYSDLPPVVVELIADATPRLGIPPHIIERYNIALDRHDTLSGIVELYAVALAKPLPSYQRTL